MTFQDYPDITQNDTEAEARYQAARRIDPFPDIPPSLLNSADVEDYVRMTGMVTPFHKGKLKSASYEAAIAGGCMWWDERRQFQEVRLQNPGDKFVLRQNSIAFVQVEPKFRLPDYMALRFNLKIKHVHRGILLGTGPLVDPGFVGKLLIPLHNLTTNDYELQYGEGLIWIEFTKTSEVPEGGGWALTGTRGLSRKGVYQPFPVSKQDQEPEAYFYHAAPHRTIRSSIPEAILVSSEAAGQSAQAARDASRRARRIARRLQTLGGAGLAALVLALASLAYGTWSLIGDTRAALNTSEERLKSEVGRRESARDERIRNLEGRLESLTKDLSTVSRQVEKVMDEARRPGSGARKPAEAVK
jgi:deoxycytidine triphosphate deaminase